MKSAVFYAARTKLTRKHNQHGRQDNAVYVRMEVVNQDYPEAIEKAKPMDGETVLNSIPLG